MNNQRIQELLKSYGLPIVVLIGFILFVREVYDSFTLFLAITITVISIVLAILFKFYPPFQENFKKGDILYVFGNNIRRFYILIILNVIIWLPVGIKYFNQDTEPKRVFSEIKFNPIFQPKDSTSFNVLILHFEDYFKNKETDCISRAIQENLNNLSSNESLLLYLNAQYIDSVKQPRNRKEAETIQYKHNADLIIYGVARNVLDHCAGAELAFRYSISENVISKAKAAIKVKSFKHDSKYEKAIPTDIEQDSLKVNSISLKKWTRALINLKADNPNEAFLELDDILNEARDLVQLGTEIKNGEKYITLKEISNKKNRYSSISKTYFNLELYQKALTVFNEAISLYPEESSFYQNRGATYAKLKKFDNSLQDFTKAILLNPEDAAAYSNRGGVYEYLNENQKAMDDYNQAISIDSTFSYTYFNKGNLYLQSADYEKAINEYSTVISLNPEDLNAYINRSTAHIYLKQYHSAIEDLKKVIKSEPENISALNNISAAFSYLELYSEANQFLAKSISIDPKSSSSHQNLGILFSQMKEYEKSVKSFNTAIELDSLFAFAYNNRAYALLKMNNLKAAYSDLVKSKSLDDKNSWVYRNLACYYIKKSNNGYALENLEKAIFLGYDDISWLETEELLSPIQDQVEFKKLLKKISIKK